MEDKKGKLYSEQLKNLSMAFYRAANHPEYTSRTYSGEDFYNALMAWEDAWFDLAYNSTDIDVEDYWEKPDCFKYKLVKWTHWAHNFNQAWRRGFKEKTPFPYPEFLSNMFDITHRFLCARSKEEESEILDISYRVDFINKEKAADGTEISKYKVKKYVWLTEENVGIKSNMLPRYAPYDLTDVLRGRKLYNFYRKNYKDSTFINVNEWIAEDKELWKCYRKAVKKGVLIDNKGKSNGS